MLTLPYFKMMTFDTFRTLIVIQRVSILYTHRIEKGEEWQQRSVRRNEKVYQTKVDGESVNISLLDLVRR